jgi:ABC-type uncharacterized transport system permease subunit
MQFPVLAHTSKSTTTLMMGSLVLVAAVTSSSFPTIAAAVGCCQERSGVGNGGLAGVSIVVASSPAVVRGPWSG